MSDHSAVPQSLASRSDGVTTDLPGEPAFQHDVAHVRDSAGISLGAATLTVHGVPGAPDEPDFISALPSELVSAIFRLLDLPDRLTISHVCASWRRAALSDPFLWSSFTLSVRGTLERRVHRATVALTALLSRSRPLPFQLYCEDDVPSAVMGLVFAHIQRIGVLHVEYIEAEDLQRLQDIEAPLLTDFACRWSTPSPDVTWTVPSRWALHIQHLDLRFPCAWPSGCVFGALRSFSGLMPGGGRGFGGSLADHFPSLRSLRLVNVTQESLDNLTSLPDSLTMLQLGTTTSEGIDCARLLRSWQAPRLHELCIYSVCTAPSALEALRVFTRTVTGPWNMQAVGGSMILWAEPYHFDIACTVPDWLSREPGIPSCWGQLRELHMSLRGFLQFRKSVVPGVVLPALVSTSFTIGDGEQFNQASAQDGAQIDAPALRSIELLPGSGFKSLSDVVDLVLGTFHAPVPVATLLVRTDLPDSFVKEDFSALRNFVDSVEVRSMKNILCTKIDMRDER